MSSVIDSIERRQQRQGLPSFAPGDRVRVHFEVVEGNRRRTQVFEGVVLRRQGSGARETFTVRKQSFGVGVERTFPLHSPKIEKLEIAARGDVRRAKLYYLRGRIGKAARVAERRWGIDDELVSAPQPEPQDEAVEAAGPVAEDGDSSSQAAGESPPSTPPAEETSEQDPQAEAPVEEAEEQAQDEGSAEEPSAEADVTEDEQPQGEQAEDEAPAEEAEDEPPGEEPEAEAEDSGEGKD